MVKLVALFRRPADPEAFDRRYFDEHLPLARQMPGLRRLEVSRFIGAPQGEPPYHLMAELWFDDLESLKAAMASAEGRAGAKNLISFAADIVQFSFAIEEVQATG